MIEKFFGFNPKETTIRTEIMAGITTFLTMAYILAVNPNILSVSEYEVESDVPVDQVDPVDTHVLPVDEVVEEVVEDIETGLSNKMIYGVPGEQTEPILIEDTDMSHTASPFVEFEDVSIEEYVPEEYVPEEYMPVDYVPMDYVPFEEDVPVEEDVAVEEHVLVDDEELEDHIPFPDEYDDDYYSINSDDMNIEQKDEPAIVDDGMNEQPYEEDDDADSMDTALMGQNNSPDMTHVPVPVTDTYDNDNFSDSHISDDNESIQEDPFRPEDIVLPDDDCSSLSSAGDLNLEVHAVSKPNDVSM